MQQILIVEDDPSTADIVQRFFSKSNYQVWIKSDGREAAQFIQDHHQQLSLIVLDLIIPGWNGVRLCEWVRQRQLYLPILVLTALGDTQSIIHALEVGADDYLTKPYSLAELGARVRSLLRRPSYYATPKLTLGQLSLDLEQREARFSGEDLRLRRREFDLLYYLLQNRNQTLTRDKIMLNVWGLDADPYPNTIDVHIRQLRKKLSNHKADNLIQTVHGIGYKLKIAEPGMGSFIRR